MPSRRLVYLLAFLLAVGVYRLFFMPLPLPAQGLNFYVERGANWRVVAQNLVEKDIIIHSLSLRILLWVHLGNSTLRPGKLTLRPPMSLMQLVSRLSAEPDANPLLRVIEGQRFADLRKLLAEREDVTQTIAEMSDAEIMRVIGATESHPEGWFAPDSYDIAEGERDVSVLRRLYLRQKKILTEEWAQRAINLPYKTPEEALIMASIIEKETAIADERQRVAGVFVRRLMLGMRLQTDPTVIYGVGDAYQGRILRSHLLHDNPYNTYRHAGLPPTPIALPGKAAIHAALHPADGDALFFVANDKGEHVFSATYEDHKKAVQRYQR